MNILIAGASGFIGRELTKVLSDTHHVSVLGRTIDRLEQCFPDAHKKITWENLDSHDAKQFDIIINLSGSNIGEKRWTQAVKQELIESRTLTNKKLIDWLIKQEAYPHYYCANAIGIYGAHDKFTSSFDENSIIDETHASNDFLKRISLDWQQSLQPAIDRGIKVTTLRFGVVLKKGEGMLKKLEIPFSLGLGSIFGHGQQIISWIHYKDLVNAIIFLLEHLNLTGAINITSPHPVSQKEFAEVFAAALKRPLFLRMPAFFVKALFGEMGEYLILKGQNVVPKRLLELNFKFQYPTLTEALEQEYKKI